MFYQLSLIIKLLNFVQNFIRVYILQNFISKFLLLIIALGCHFVYSQKRVIDTLESNNGKVLLYSNLSWVYLKDKNFDGVMNQEIYDKIKEMGNGKFSQPWSNSRLYPSNKYSDPHLLKDTLWLCLQNDGHGDFVMPVPGIRTSPYGPRNGRNHNGVDLDLDTGDTVKTCWSGKVRYSKYNDGGFGNLVIVRHYNGLETFYAHLSKLLVFPNQEVIAGEPIGLGGNTGHSYGSHLHFEIRFFDVPFDPELIIDVKKKKIKTDNLFIHKSFFNSKPKSTSKPTSKSNTTKKPVARSKKKYHKIRSGDTLTGIAARHHTSVSKICKLNRIKPTTILNIGRSLRVR